MQNKENPKLKELKNRLQEIRDLQSASAVLGWDQHTYMPPGGGPARGRQMALLRRLAHERSIDPTVGRLLDDLASYEERLPYESDEASIIRIARRDYERATKVPPAFMARFSEHTAASFQAWAKARPANDFAKMVPYLQKTLDLSRQLADFFPGYEHIADPLIDFADYGMKASTVSAIFSDLREQLVPIVQAIAAQPVADDACLQQHFPREQQLAFGATVIRRFGYDFERGREDESPHPFTTSFSINDVRITTRVNEEFLGDALFGTMHESGHAMYEQGIAPELEGTGLDSGTSSGVHESQSRLWENVVGRSRGFWRFFYPKLQEIFPEQLGDVSLDAFYRAINKVAPSLIRVSADEATYNLHVMLRFDFELRLLEGELAVHDLPDAWRERFQADLGIAPPDDRDGVLQDMHWFFGRVGGMFQGYTLGNILSAQFYEAALDAHPEIPDEIEQGRFDALHGWLRDRIYRHGSKFTPAELIERVTGGPLSAAPYIRYLRDKYGELYDL
jgi:carboxypeptidase Taq